MDHISNVDLIRSRMKVSYQEASGALEASGGDIVKALIYLENKQEKPPRKDYSHADEFANHLKGFIRRGQESKIKIKRHDRTVFEVPATVGALGLLGMLASSQLAVLGALSSVVAMSKDYKLELDRNHSKAEAGKAPSDTEL